MYHQPQTAWLGHNNKKDKYWEAWFNFYQVVVIKDFQEIITKATTMLMQVKF